METKKNIARSTREITSSILICALAAATASVACSSKPRASVKQQEVSAKLQPAAFEGAPSIPPAPDVKQQVVSISKPVPNKLINFKSRDYGVSFTYPYQYAFLNARNLANADPSMQPKSDGHESRFTLARVDVPKGFFPDTNFDQGYFTLSLNQDLNDEECTATLGKDSKLSTETINGIEFRWVESEDGGHGSSAKVRNYVAYTNGTCYELELGVKTKNEQGLAREVNEDQVLRRLNAMAKSVKIAQLPAAAVAQTVEPAADSEEPKN